MEREESVRRASARRVEGGGLPADAGHGNPDRRPPCSIPISSSVTVTVLDDDTPPGAPQELTAQADDASPQTAVRLSWQAPESEGDFPIARYEARWKKTADLPFANADTWTEITVGSAGLGGAGTEADPYTWTATGLEPGTGYSFEVRAAHGDDGAGAGDAATETAATAAVEVAFGAAAATVNEGESIAVTVTLSAPAPAGGVTVPIPGCRPAGCRRSRRPRRVASPGPCGRRPCPGSPRRRRGRCCSGCRWMNGDHRPSPTASGW